MAFTATFDLAINGVTKTLNRIRFDGYSSEYLKRTSTEEYRIFVRNSDVKSKKPDPLLRGVERHNVEVVHRIFATSTTPELVRRAYTVFEHYAGDDQTAVSNFVVGSFADIGNAGIVADLLGWQA
ncbi:MAG: putative coat protein [Garnievirus faecadaptatum]|uniref:Coat protein n=1 Tax=Leviviridae sp. TaxID=2027243 RepID=A0ABY3SUD7_9VIRU|nr:MAG: putative coat protein [Leviviridae sp.]